MSDAAGRTIGSPEICVHRYAQTNVQLFNQLGSEGYAKQDILLIWKTYEFGMRLFSGLFLPSGKPFIDHLIGTASILAWLRVPVEVVGAGLIHAAYLHGDFGSVRQGVTVAKRNQVSDRVGVELEEYVFRYDRLTWSAATMPSTRDVIHQLSPLDRTVLLIRLANQLEHHLDLGAFYFSLTEKAQARHRRHLEHYGPVMTDMAQRLGFPSLAAEMEKVFKNAVSTVLPVGPCIRTNHRMAFPLVPNSCRHQLWVTASRKLIRAYGVLKSKGGRLKRLDFVRNAFR